MRVGLAKFTIDAIMKGINKKWIAEISLYGMNRQGLCAGELFVKIDWQRNAFQLAAGKDSIRLDQSWNDGVSVEVEKTLALFLDFLSAENLNIKCTTRYASGVDRAHANSVLGFSPGKKVTWVSGTVGTAMTIPELDEFTIGVNFSQ
jgi:hypothetical protein